MPDCLIDVGAPAIIWIQGIEIVIEENTGRETGRMMMTTMLATDAPGANVAGVQTIGTATTAPTSTNMAGDENIAEKEFEVQ